MKIPLSRSTTHFLKIRIWFENKMNKKQLILPILILFLTISAFAQESAEKYLEQGVAYDKQGDIYKAIDYYSKAIEIDPNRIEAYYARAMDHYWLREWDKAWADVYKVQESETGVRFPSQFIVDLKNASGKHE